MRRRLNDEERGLLTHVSRFGSDGYPVRKLGRRGWLVDHAACRFPVVFKTKREAVATFEGFLGLLREARGIEARRDRLREIVAHVPRAEWSREWAHDLAVELREDLDAALREGDNAWRAEIVAELDTLGEPVEPWLRRPATP